MSTYHSTQRKRNGSHVSDYAHHRYHQLKCITFTSSFFLHLFIATTIVASQPDQSVAMNILNDRIRDDAASIEHHQIVLNEKLSPQKFTVKGRRMTMPFPFKSHLLLDKDSDQSMLIRESIYGPACNCSNGKSTKMPMASCMQICNYHQQKHSKKFKRKRKQNSQNHVEKREHLTLIYAISNNTVKSQRIVPIESGEMMETKFRRKPTHRHPTTQFDEKSLNNNNAYETNVHSRTQATYNSHKMAFQPDEHLVILQNIDDKNNRIKSDATQFQRTTVDESVDSNYGKSVKRIARSIGTEMLSTQSNEKNMTKWQASVFERMLLSATEDSTNIKYPVNGNFDSTMQRGGADEINGSVVGNTIRSNTSTEFSEYRILLVLFF